MSEIVLWDTEFTSWPGAQERGWSGENEHREFIQIAALKFDVETRKVTDTFEILCKPTLNPELSDFIQELTKITQAQIDEHGVSVPEAIGQFIDFIKAEDGYPLPSWSFGRDDLVLRENCDINSMLFPCSSETFHDLQAQLKEKGIKVKGYSSGSLYQLFGLSLDGHVHNALHDCRSLAASLRHLLQQGQVHVEELVPQKELT
jgi:inhibitor of KinA sporulation pathway (predicted exonuclease)